MDPLCINQHVHKAAVNNDYELIAKLLKHETLDNLFQKYIMLKYHHLDLYLDYIVQLARERIVKLEIQQTLEQKFCSDIAAEICDFL
jgi:hypothetical protein